MRARGAKDGRVCFGIVGIRCTKQQRSQKPQGSAGVGSLACTTGELREVGVVLRAACGRRGFMQVVMPHCLYSSRISLTWFYGAACKEEPWRRKQPKSKVAAHIEMMMRALVN